MSINITNPRNEKPKRAKKVDGQFKADDKSTPDVNEAWVGGEPPKKVKKKKSSKS
jgi:hypothetical protein